MNIESQTITEAIRITDMDGLDPITVVFQDTAPEQGRIWVECYGNAWASWWPAMGSRTVRQFVADVDPDYLARNLVWGRMASQSKKADTYLLRISTAIVNALKAA
jgi:hypothetical protein